MKEITQDEKVQVTMVLLVAAAATAIIVGALWWNCGGAFSNIAQCVYGVK